MRPRDLPPDLALVSMTDPHEHEPDALPTDVPPDLAGLMTFDL
jgi:hypothetical protein